MTGHPSDFDARARTWDEDASKLDRARRVGEAIVKRVPSLSGKTVLEYGAGTGLLGLTLQPLVAEVTLADSSREMLAVAQEKIASRGIRNAKTLHLDLAVGPVPELRFDVICTLMTLHHIPDTDGILRAFHRLLSSGGLLRAPLHRRPSTGRTARSTGRGSQATTGSIARIFECGWSAAASATCDSRPWTN